MLFAKVIALFMLLEKKAYLNFCKSTLELN